MIATTTGLVEHLRALSHSSSTSHLNTRDGNGASVISDTIAQEVQISTRLVNTGHFYPISRDDIRRLNLLIIEICRRRNLSYVICRF